MNAEIQFMSWKEGWKMKGNQLELHFSFMYWKAGRHEGVFNKKTTKNTEDDSVVDRTLKHTHTFSLLSVWNHWYTKLITSIPFM